MVSKGATNVERVVVKRMKDGTWLVWHDGRTISVYPTEEQALSAALRMASNRKQQGFEAVIIIEQEKDGDDLNPS